MGKEPILDILRREFVYLQTVCAARLQRKKTFSAPPKYKNKTLLLKIGIQRLVLRDITDKQESFGDMVLVFKVNPESS